MTERSIPAAGDEPFVRRGETSHPAAEAAFIPEPVYARREARKRKGVPPALYVAPVVGVALLGGLALMTGSGTPQTAAPEAATQAQLTSQAAPTALAANTLAAPETEIATPAVEPAPEAAVEPAPAARRTPARPAPEPAAAPAAPSALDSGADVAAELPEAPIPYSAAAQSSAPAPTINTTPLDIPSAQTEPSGPAAPAAEQKPMTF